MALCPPGRKREKFTEIEANVEGCLQHLHNAVMDFMHPSSLDFTNLCKNSEDATIFGTPVKSASGQWVARKVLRSLPSFQGFEIVRKTMGNSLVEIKHVSFLSFFEEHRKVSIDAKKHYCSNGCEGNQKVNKNLVLACFSSLLA